MIILPNGCRCSELKVFPQNWKSVSASLQKDWYIHYRFYDDQEREKYPNGKQVSIRGMNRMTRIVDRQAATKVLLNHELDLLQFQGYNPITNNFYVPEYKGDLETHTPFIAALRLAATRIKGVTGTMTDIRSVIKGTEKAAKTLGYNNIPIAEIKRKHIKLILEECQRTNPRFSAHRYNKYRAYLTRMFKELVELEAAQVNPVRDISKMKETKKIRIVLTMEERKKVDEHLQKVNRPFWLFVQIFFHSGARITELLRLQGKDVNLQTQQYKSLIKKGHSREVNKTIKDIALPFWQEAMANCGPNDYVFSEGLKPLGRPIRSDRMWHKWKTWVQVPLEIKATLYSLKHSNTSEVVGLLSDQDAAKLNSHTSTAMVRSIYDVGRTDREHNRLKGVCNSLS